ncbi:MAG: YbhB/YbcL family Raf kinase inhibitor-like protein [Armatimonadetes bacterium]|nr:YbhB/YbcL family Raf kinase inhibitor-like protein [Armatimonadota bacterium]
MSMTLTSSAFAPGAAIPAKHGYRTGNVSPPLQWTDPPAGTRAFALVVDDPDAPSGEWVHWVLLNLPADTRELPEGVKKDARLADGSLHGKNDFGNLGWDGPSPPSGTHRYVFKLFALDGPLALASGASKQVLLKAAAGHTLGTAELTGTYSR